MTNVLLRWEGVDHGGDYAGGIWKSLYLFLNFTLNLKLF